ncbi:glycosyltransferase [Rufibacter hautae]|uniref:Glycosyltransferase n=1 Tax=Rufibacter hautae TaxID=2595005 RepID=A0A5B6TJJ0_9BACT|nr:glycosyltransferase [Rufibacter hautae]KAA3439600.1 glycosyltransferase [Rufibacter hautae]
MKILRVIGSMNPASGGPCQGIRNSIPELEKLGVSNEVVCLDSPEAAFLGKDEFTIHALGPGKGPWNYSPKLSPWLLENLPRFDAVIVHGLWLHHGYAVRSALNKLRLKTTATKPGGHKLPGFFVMPHGMLDPYFQKAAGRKLKALRNWVYWKLIEGRIINEAAGVLFTCEAELSLAREPFTPYFPKREINVGYGIPEPPQLTSSMEESFFALCPDLRTRPYLLFLSRIHEKKGIDLLLKAYAELTMRHHLHKPVPELAEANDSSPNSTLAITREWPALVIAGPGLDTPYGKTLQKQAEETTLLGNRSIYFPGMLTGETKWGAFYGCEAFILPSHQENFGIAVAEALACSKPVLISDQVNIWREIAQTGGGLLAKDTQEGTKELLSTWTDLSEEERGQMRSNARTTYEAFFAIKPHALRVWEALKQS